MYKFTLGGIIFILSTVVAMDAVGPVAAQAIVAPDQPLTGPGGQQYAHDSVIRRGPYWAQGHRRDNDYRYYIYEPSDPKPAQAPVVLFLHAWSVNHPRRYIDWIEHIVRHGYSVVWVQFDQFLSPFRVLADQAGETWEDALKRMEQRPWERHVLPERDALGRVMTATVGHSIGGSLAFVLAALAADPDNGMPRPLAIVSIEPGGLALLPDRDLSAIDPTTKMIIVVGDEDPAVCAETGIMIWEQTAQIPDENRDFLVMLSDRRGTPQQIANHSFPFNTSFNDTAAVDTRDYYITFKLSVAAANCVSRDIDCEYAFGDGNPEQLDMGLWSDGFPVQPLIWIENPSPSLQTTCNPMF